ncbi:WGR domain-containing protein [Coralloluteibacterium stylophorae]|uniref:WGR domain-containing protein n=1 Tax=Coralloluteibacterium stylophorae TaxID=1776034 RepID=A0A8J8AW83_9GAMM|nr:WGR domain-containing protein [Coralloluteibacterium stylophorae]MBS7456407.1 WGR domain-containing protein [Coralloluteibacterium stylophorae]
MRLLLQHPPVADEPVRFVRLSLDQDLLGGWTLTRESGQLGGRSTLRRDQFLDRAEADAAFARLRDQQLKRGFVAAAGD